MDIDWAAVGGIVLKIGSLSGLVALAFTFAVNRRRRARLKFQQRGMSGTHIEIDNDAAKLHGYRWEYQGILNNQSVEPTSVNNIMLVVWGNRRRHQTKAYGYAGLSVREAGSNSPIALPVRLEGRASMAVVITFETVIEGTEHQRILAAFRTIETPSGTRYTEPQFEYELLFEDVGERLFDAAGHLVNRREIDLRWTLPNALAHLANGKRGPLLKHRTSLAMTRVQFSGRRVLRFFGFD